MPVDSKNPVLWNFFQRPIGRAALIVGTMNHITPYGFGIIDINTQIYPSQSIYEGIWIGMGHKLYPIFCRPGGVVPGKTHRLGKGKDHTVHCISDPASQCKPWVGSIYTI